MINTISYVVPFIGLVVCLFVVFTHHIDTKCPIRITKMALWLIVWTIVLFLRLSVRCDQSMVNHDSQGNDVSIKYCVYR
jgi:hypothetical protein